ncbi:nucleophile aminohydrolase [Entophlyctis helioformis]|nr:nucleophile aminohydrolase [Entophlyctis helioformis]
MAPLVAVHAGAGIHSATPAALAAYEALLARTTLSTLALLRGGCTATDAAVHAVRLLEDSPLTNAGICGANLSLARTVECDAAIMASDGGRRDGRSSGRQAFGGVGAVPMALASPTDTLADTVVAHPIDAARWVMDGDAAGRDAVGRVPPVLVAGPHVHAYVGPSVPRLSPAAAAALVCDTQLRRYDRHMRLLEGDDGHADGRGVHADTNAGVNATVVKEDSEPGAETRVYDTVGAVVMDDTGAITAAVSSGGISLKHPGRVGEAALYGTGVWAQRRSSGRPGVGISVTGMGEQIIKLMVASRLAERLGADTAGDAGHVVTDFVERDVLGNGSRLLDDRDDERCVGFVCLVVADPDCADTDSGSDGSGSDCGSRSDSQPPAKRHCGDADQTGQQPRVELWWAHTTKSMALAYMSASDDRPVFEMSVQATHGRRAVVSGRSFR